MRVRHAFALVGLCTLATAAIGGEIAPADVQIIEGEVSAPLTDTPGDAKAGREIFANRKQGNCLACHMVTDLLDDEQFHGEVGPPLDGVGETYTAAELRARIVNPKTELPETIMPSFYRVGSTNRTAKKFAGKTILSAQQVEDVVAYLLTLKE